MNIIIVARPHAAPVSIDLNSWHGRFKVGIAVALCGLTCAGLGVCATLVFAGPSDHALAGIRAMHAQVLAQQGALDALDASSHRNLDALALKLGELQAQATRLNALGERLTQVGKLEDGEFDFKEAPALGGPEDASATSHVLDEQFSASIVRMHAQFDEQEAQLSVLENLLLDRKISNALLPQGMPVASGYIGSGYGGRTDPINGHSEFHSGIDFDAAPGTPIQAVAEGVVTWNGERPGYGNVVEVDHGNGYMTRYAHNQQNVVAVGTRVHAGQIIAKVGSTGRATGPHCHFEVWLDGHPVNPLSYVQGKHHNG